MSDNTAWPIFIEPDELHRRLNQHEHSGDPAKPQILIWDLSAPEAYQSGHLPNAVWAPFAKIRSGEPPIQGLLPSKDSLSTLFSQLGLQDHAQVVLYDDDGGGKSGRMGWTLDVIGHHQYSILNGGLAAWEAAEFEGSKDTFLPTPTDYKVSYFTEELVVTKEWLLEHLDNPQLCIWDARSQEEYEGQLVRAARGGHVPGAINYEWTKAMNLHPHRSLRPLDQVKRELASLGITGDKTIVTHCQTHHRSGFTYALGKALGFKDIRAYPGSWSEWGNDSSTPVKA